MPLESGYFEAYNRDNVLLVDLNETPIERITPNGVRTSDKDYEFDILVYATGFDGVTGAFDRIDFRGPGGVRLRDVWADGPRTYLGWMPEGFPNMLMVLGPHTARGNIPRAVEHGVECLTGLLEFMRAHNYTRVETRPEQVAEWTQTVIKASEPLLSSKIDSWQTGVNPTSKAAMSAACLVITATVCTTGANATRSRATATGNSHSADRRNPLERPRPERPRCNARRSSTRFGRSTRSAITSASCF